MRVSKFSHVSKIAAIAARAINISSSSGQSKPSSTLMASSSSPAAARKVVAEYAKSGRSGCKDCGKTIASGSLRLGIVAKDPRGFEATKWHHLACFNSSATSHQLRSVEDINGFSLLHKTDQELLKEWDSTHQASATVNQVDEQDDSEPERPKTKSAKKLKVENGDDSAGGQNSGRKSFEKPKKVVAEYAKSSKSSCNSCGKPIELGSLRLGLISRDPRGFDMTKWHHTGCLQLHPHLIGSVEDIEGFSSLKILDQEMLKKWDHLVISKQEIPEESLIGKSDKDQLEIAFSIALVMDKYKDAMLSDKWKAFQTVIFRERDDGLRDSEKIAAFDFDGCLVNTSVKKIGPDAWSLMYPSIPGKLRSLFDKGYKLVIFTNESNIERWKNRRQVAVDSKIGRIDNFVKLVDVPMQAFIACGLGKGKDQTVDPFRKPKTGMWRLLADHFNSGVTIDMEQSFYVGDAAGRPTDHSDADIKFAQAIGLKFHLPENYFGS